MRLILPTLLLLALFMPLRAQVTEPPDTLYRANPLYAQRTKLWDAYPTTHATVVMLGNSITQGADWGELLGRGDVVNRGIVSDNTAGYLARMTYVTRLHPSVCCVMGGINDLYAGFSVERILTNYAEILDTLIDRRITPVVQATLLVSPKWHHAREKNILVGQLNEGLRKLCSERGVPYLDLNPELAADGVLRDEYTTDGVHLTGAAYSVWAARLKPLLAGLTR